MSEPCGRAGWNRCDVCGRVIAYEEFTKTAEHWMETPDSEVSHETWRTEHNACTEPRG